MIALLGSCIELLAKLDKDEQIKYITKAMSLIWKESAMFEDKYTATITAMSRLFKIKSKILTGEGNISHIYPILEVDSEDKGEDTANELE